MANIAEIGVAFDTSSLNRGVADLGKAVPAARAVEEAAGGAAGALGAVGAAITGAGDAATAARRGLDGASNSTNALAANSNKLTAALQKQTSVQQRINAMTGVTLSPTDDRAADIAAYGTALDNLRAKYDPLFAAGRTYKATLMEINEALKVGALNERQHAEAIMTTKTSFTQQVNALTGVTERENTHTAAANKAKTATAGFSFEAKNLSYQLVDVTQGLASGISPMQIFAQQAGQIGQVLATAPKGGGALFKEIGSAIAGFLTPMRLAVAGVIAIGVAAYAAFSSWKNFAIALSDTANIAGTTTKSMMALQAAASFKGISGDDFTQGMRSFSQSVYDAKNNMGGLADVFAANNVKAKDFDDALSKAANLIKNASGDQQRLVLLQQMGLPATMEWVRLLSSGAAGLAKAKEQAAAFTADDGMIQSAKRFDEAWNKAWTNFGLRSRKAIQDATNTMSNMIDEAKIFASKVAQGLGGVGKASFGARFMGNETNPITDNLENENKLRNALTRKAEEMAGKNNAASGKATVDPNAAKNALSLQIQQISILGDLATVEQQVTMKTNELALAGLNHVNVTAKQRDAILDAAKAQAQQNLVNQQAQAGIFNQSLAQEAANGTLRKWISMGVVDASNAQQMAAAREVLNRSIRDTKDAAEQAASALPGLTRLSQEAGDFSKLLDNGLTSSLNQITAPITDALNGVTSFGDAFKNVGLIVLKAIQEMVIKMLIIAPIAKMLKGIFDGMLGGTGGGIMSLFSGLFGGGKALGEAYNSGGVQAFANGGAFTNSIVASPTLFKYGKGGQFGMMGEAGPEAIMPLMRGPGGSLGVQMYGGNNNSGGGATQISYSPQYNVAQGADPRAIEQLQRARQEDQRNAPKVIADTIVEMRKRGVRI